MSKKSKISATAILLVLVIALIGLYVSLSRQSKPILLPQKIATTQPANTYGMSEYTDPTYGFSFWYPSTLQITSKAMEDETAFPGGVAVETLQIGSLGGTSVVVVNSTTNTITDEPSNHASPIAQTKYTYNNTSGKWLVSFPEGQDGAGSGATTIADTSKTTMSGLFMLPSGKRFDTTIIPLSTTRFIVISDGGGSSFTSELAQTVSQVGASIDPTIEATVLQNEATAYLTNE